MNATATLALARPGGRGRNGLSVGWGVSLLVHAAIVAWLLHALPPRAPESAPARRIEVRLAPPAPAPAPAAHASPATSAAPAAAAPSRAPARARAPARPAPAAPAPAYLTRPAPARTTPDTNEQAAAPASDTPAASNTPAESPDAPRVDIAGARQAARLIARGEGKSLVALPARKPVTDPNADRAEPVDPIEAARRKDCKTAYAGAGLLAVIPLAIDAVRSAANDSGCKW